MTGYFPQRFIAALRAISERCFGVILAKPLGTLFFPPLRPSSTAAAFFLAINRKYTTSAYGRPTKNQLTCRKRLWHTQLEVE